MANSFKLGDWRAEPDLNRLVGSDGAEVKVEPKAMDVLVYLVRRHGEVVSSAEIVEAVWAGYPLSENPVYKTIGRLRSTLGDDPKNPNTFRRFRRAAIASSHQFQNSARQRQNYRVRVTQERRTQSAA